MRDRRPRDAGDGKEEAAHGSDALLDRSIFKFGGNYSRR
jgi:hypothetical protein